MPPGAYTLFPLFSILIITTSTCTATRDTISSGHPLVGGEKPVSHNDKFALGFFQTTGNTTTAPRWYLCTWFNAVSNLTPAWVVANRESPLADGASPELMVSEDGNLVILNRSDQSILWSSRPWNGHHFSNMLEVADLFTVEFVSDDEEEYFTYQLKNDSLITRDGVLPFCNCMDGFSIMSPQDWDLGDRTGGCKRNIHLNCCSNQSANGLKGSFYALSDIRFPGERGGAVPLSVLGGGIVAFGTSTYC
ncbi:hypothetical protein BAE44_0017551 [Dichanthelium oligosanthes]|uniref:non-specific serine/threonine protein kinase n=1 Tax=Dichanthelium oligosanthes TaxID=888268 RepID=A0A1E5V8I1_9POAL|nr:hypothetical protein BAE44_0017551 [Dichanthelium oligosanthes]